MPLLPVSTVRTSTPLSMQRSLYQLNADQVALQKDYDQLSTGRRVLRISDDPAAAGRAIDLQRGIDRSNQLIRNANSTSAFYHSADSSLARITDSLTEARGVTVEAAQNVLSADERNAYATSIRQTLESILGAGNSLFRDQQLLGGALDSGQAYQISQDGVLFGGNDAVGRAEFGAGQASPINVTGNAALGVYSTIVKGQSLNAALDRDTRLVDMKGGAGVKAGVIRLSDGNEWQPVDLSNASSIGDIKDVLEKLDLHGRTLTATISGDAIQIEYTDGLPGTLAIDNGTGSTLATDLGIENRSGLKAPPIVGNRLAPRITSNTKVTDLAFGAGVDLASGFQISQGDKVFNVDVSQAKTVGDVIIAINRSGADVRAELDQNNGRIEIHSLLSGVDYSIGETGGSTAAGLGIRSATGATLLSDLGRGVGVHLDDSGPDFVITRPDGTVLPIELGSAQTIDDVINLIRNHPLNQDSSKVLVSLNEFGNGIQLKAPPGTGELKVSQGGLSDAGIRLGLIPEGQSEAVGTIDGAVTTIKGQDYLPLEAGGTFDTLLRLEKAVRENNIPDITRLQGRLDQDLDRASQTRGRVGVMAQNLDKLKTSVEDNIVTLTSQKSQEIDADLATVISQLTQRQTSIEATMRLIGQISQLTVLNFL